MIISFNVLAFRPLGYSPSTPSRSRRRRQSFVAGNKCAHSWHLRLLFWRQRCRLTLHASLGVCAVDDKEIDTAKMQVQGQLAAQYIQDVMQVRPEPPPQRRSITRAPWRCCTLPAC